VYYFVQFFHILFIQKQTFLWNSSESFVIAKPFKTFILKAQNVLAKSRKFALKIFQQSRSFLPCFVIDLSWNKVSWNDTSWWRRV